jgi:hypothetical protein
MIDLHFLSVNPAESAESRCKAASERDAIETADPSLEASLLEPISMAFSAFDEAAHRLGKIVLAARAQRLNEILPEHGHPELRGKGLDVVGGDVARRKGSCGLETAGQVELQHCAHAFFTPPAVGLARFNRSFAADHQERKDFRRIEECPNRFEAPEMDALMPDVE